MNLSHTHTVNEHETVYRWYWSCALDDTHHHRRHHHQYISTIYIACMLDGWTEQFLIEHHQLTNRAPNAHHTQASPPYTDSTMEIICWVEAKKKFVCFFLILHTTKLKSAVWRVPRAHQEQCHWSHCFWCCAPFSSSSSSPSSSSFFMWDDFFFFVRLLVRCERDHLYTSLSLSVSLQTYTRFTQVWNNCMHLTWREQSCIRDICWIF